MKLLTTFAAAACLVSSVASASGLVIYGTEIGVGKFHRHDNKVHSYANNNAWKPFSLPDGASTTTPVVIDNADGSVSIFFSTLEELLQSSVDAAKKHGEKIQVLNINGHGLPGGMWFPKNTQMKNAAECKDWVKTANGDEAGNYDQYYSTRDKSDIMFYRQYSNAAPVHFPCVTALPEWKDVVAGFPKIKDSFAEDVQVHFLSCIVGLGSIGENFTKAVAKLLLPSSKGRVETSFHFGLGDWSMPEGMGFWDFQNDAQLKHDNDVYPVNRKDREIMQKGNIRVASIDTSGTPTSGKIADVDFMFLDMNPTRVELAVTPEAIPTVKDAPKVLRIPGTRVYVRR